MTLCGARADHATSSTTRQLMRGEPCYYIVRGHIARGDQYPAPPAEPRADHV